MRICELREKEVINTCDCKVLGCVVDIDFDLCSGQVQEKYVGYLAWTQNILSHLHVSGK